MRECVINMLVLAIIAISIGRNVVVNNTLVVFYYTIKYALHQTKLENEVQISF